MLINFDVITDCRGMKIQREQKVYYKEIFYKKSLICKK